MGQIGEKKENQQSVLIRRRLCPIPCNLSLFFNVICRRRGPRPVPIPLPISITSPIITYFPPTIWGWAASTFWSPTPPSPFAITVVSTVSVAVVTAARAARAFTVASGTVWRGGTPVVTPDRGRRVLGPLDTQTGSFKVSSMHFVIGILGITLASEFHKGIAAR